VPLSLLARPCFDYVALGHVHRHQVLCDQPYIVYPGSIERVDFSEETEDKGFVLIDLAKNDTRMEFCPLPVRPFCTIRVDLSKAKDPQAQLLKVIAKENIQDAVVRLIYQLRSEQLDQIDNAALQQVLESAHTHTIHAELISQLARPRLPELGTGHHMEPLDALKAYLANQPDLDDIAQDMLDVATALITAQPDLDAEESPTPDFDRAPAQLSLL
jgi:DNA repair protein SbcD/Mre11